MTPEDHLVAHRAAGRDFVAAGVRSFVRDEGEGETVVLLHGVPTSAWLYRKVLGQLAGRGLRGVAFDLPGMGFAERPGDFDYTWTGLGRWAAAAVDALGLGDRLQLVVHDIGGPVGLELAALHDGRFAAVTVLNTVIEVDGFTKPLQMRPFAVPLLDRLWLRGIADPVFVTLFRQAGLHDRSASTRAELLVHKRLLLRDGGGAAFLRIMKGFETTAAKQRLYTDTLRAIPRRQVLWGEHDLTLPLQTLGEAARRAAAVDEVQRLPGRHFVQEDCAPQIADAVAALAAG